MDNAAIILYNNPILPFASQLLQNQNHHYVHHGCTVGLMYHQFFGHCHSYHYQKSPNWTTTSPTPHPHAQTSSIVAEKTSTLPSEKHISFQLSVLQQMKLFKIKHLLLKPIQFMVLFLFSNARKNKYNNPSTHPHFTEKET